MLTEATTTDTYQVSLVKPFPTTYVAGDGKPFLIDPDTSRLLDRNEPYGLAYFLFEGGI